MCAVRTLSNVMCSLQRALIGNVTPNLRAVYIRFENEIYELVFFYDKALSEEEEELASLTDTEFIADFPSTDKTNCTIEVLPYPKQIPKQGRCVYMRYEKSTNDADNKDN